MARRALAFACALMLAAPLAGCFVIDELDKGSKIMDQHGGGKAKAAQEPAASTAAPVGKKDAIDAYFKKEEEEGTTKTFSPGTVDESIVACKLAGSVQFMKREQCAARGGRSS